MTRSLALLAVFACLAIAAAGCGSSSSSSSTASTSSVAPSGTSSGSPAGSGSGSTSGSSGGSSQSGAGGSSGSGASSGGSSGSGSSGSSGGQTGDNSIQTYGNEVTGSDKDAIVNSMVSFFRALAAPNYAKVCSGLSSGNLDALQQFAKIKKEQGKGCATLLPTLIPSQTATAKKAADGTIVHVRSQGDNAFVLFTPSGSKSVNYFVMKKENGAWKSTSLATGTPLNPALP